MWHAELLYRLVGDQCKAAAHHEKQAAAGEPTQQRGHGLVPSGQHEAADAAHPPTHPPAKGHGADPLDLE